MPILVRKPAAAYILHTKKKTRVRVYILFCRLFDVAPRHRRRSYVLLGVDAFILLNISCLTLCRHDSVAAGCCCCCYCCLSCCKRSACTIYILQAERSSNSTSLFCCYYIAYALFFSNNIECTLHIQTSRFFCLSFASSASMIERKLRYA